MGSHWKTDLSWSAKAFIELVWPILQRHIGGRLISVETNAKLDMARTLDIEAGVDAWHVMNGIGVRGIASRMQVCPPPRSPYNTFTIRRSRKSGARTEYAKRLLAVRSDGQLLYPHFTVQGYVNQYRDNKLLSFGLTETKKLIEYIAANKGGIEIKATSNADFYIVPFAQIATFVYPTP